MYEIFLQMSPYLLLTYLCFVFITYETELYYNWDTWCQKPLGEDTPEVILFQNPSKCGFFMCQRNVFPCWNTDTKTKVIMSFLKMDQTVLSRFHKARNRHHAEGPFSHITERGRQVTGKPTYLVDKFSFYKRKYGAMVRYRSLKNFLHHLPRSQVKLLSVFMAWTFKLLPLGSKNR